MGSQRAVDDMFPDGGRYYWKSHFVNELSDALIDSLIDLDSHRPSPQSVILIRMLGGAISSVYDTESAHPHRSARFNVSVDATWFGEGLDDTAIGWARDTWAALAPFGTGGLYVNFAGADEEAGFRTAAFGANEARLDRVRAAYDPAGVFLTGSHLIAVVQRPFT